MKNMIDVKRKRNAATSMAMKRVQANRTYPSCKRAAATTTVVFPEVRVKVCRFCAHEVSHVPAAFNNGDKNVD